MRVARASGLHLAGFAGRTPALLWWGEGTRKPEIWERSRVSALEKR
jgi:hypothetical protein